MTSYRVFAYLNAEKADLYRAVVRVFMDAKARFSLHMRPSEIASQMTANLGQAYSETDIDASLAQLCEWGNLESHPDMSEKATVEDFLRGRHLYQLTAAGEAAERALTSFEAILEQPGELKTVALGDIRIQLEVLCELAANGDLDEDKIQPCLVSLVTRFEDLTSHAQRFMGSLPVDLYGIQQQAFLSYKQTLIDYLERFIGELTMATAQISQLLNRIEEAGIDPLLSAAARRDLKDKLGATDADHIKALEQWRSKWAGLKGWFLGRPGVASQSEILRGLARSAIPNLLMAITGIHDRRATRSDRLTDLRRLAQWFAQADSDEDAHRLWRAAFGLSSTRHLGIDDATLEDREQNPVPSHTSWLEAPAIEVTPRLRVGAPGAKKVRQNKIADHAAGRAILLRVAAEEAIQIAEAQRQLALNRRVRLSDFGELDPVKFHLFLDLLGQALSDAVNKNEVVEAMSTDGSLRIVMEPILIEPNEEHRIAIVRTPHGEFRGDDRYITIQDATMALISTETNP